MGEVIVREGLEERLSYFARGNFHIVSDWDRTLTKGLSGPNASVSTWAAIYREDLADPEYLKKARAMADKYMPIEMDPNVPISEKIGAMDDWWEGHLSLIAKHGLNKSIISEIAKSDKIAQREGFEEFMQAVNTNEIPFLIISAGLGDVIQAFLEKRGLFGENVHIISNFFRFGPDGNIAGYRGSPIHVFNKNEAQVRGHPYKKLIEQRKNVILLGDSLGDVNMADGIGHDEIIKIGFLNENIEESLPKYLKAYDVLILGDGPMDYVNGLLGKLLI